LRQRNIVALDVDAALAERAPNIRRRSLPGYRKMLEEMKEIDAGS
jgi:hypothetical protein